MPFVTEEIYHLLKDQGDDLCVKQFAVVNAVDEKVLAQGELLKQVITTIRDGRNKNQLKPKETIKLFIETGARESYSSIESILCKQVNADELSFTNEAIASTIVVAVEKDKFYIKTDKELDVSTLKEDLLKDLEHQKGFLASVEKKLSNERFVQNAKQEVVDLEKKKMADAQARIKTIEESLQNLS
jgi:valyl-tRNA synthetase